MKPTVSLSDFITVPAGKYTIGMNPDVIKNRRDHILESGIKEEFILTSSPVHTVDLAEVLISKKPVTCREFEMFIDNTGYVTDAEKEGWGWIMKGKWQRVNGLKWDRPFGSVDDETYSGHSGTLPVLQVSWNDAAAYCIWLRSVTGMDFRLPGEAEWEAFAGIRGINSIEELSTEKSRVHPEEYLSTVLKEISDYDDCRPGLMWEWTSDWYQSYPGGIMHKDYGEIYKVLRGGSQLSHKIQRTREFRLRKCPTARSPYYGFRIALEIN